MKQLVTLSFAIKNTKEERNKIIKYMNYYFSIPIQETYNLLNIAYVAKLGYFRGIDFELDFPDKYTEEDMFKKLKPYFLMYRLPVKLITKTLNMTYQLNLKTKKLSQQIETQLTLQLQLKKH